MAGNETISWLSTELLQCDICLDNFIQPKMLDCGHSFCMDCIKEYLKGKLPGKLNCPTCRETTKLTPNGVEGLRNDFRAKKIEGLLNEKCSKKLEQSNRCNFCEINNTFTVAKKYCVSCCKRFCDECLARHSANEIFRDHSIIDSFAHSPHLLQNQSCSEHSHETSGFLCRTCDRLVCTLCLIGSHNGHTVIDLMTAVRNEQTKFAEIKAGVIESTNQQFAALRKACVDALDASEASVYTRLEEVTAELKKQSDFLLEDLSMLRKMKMQEVDAEWEMNITHLTNCNDVSEIVNHTSSSVHSNLSNDKLYSVATFINWTTQIKLGSLEQRSLVREQQGDSMTFRVQSVADLVEAQSGVDVETNAEENGANLTQANHENTKMIKDGSKVAFESPAPPSDSDQSESSASHDGRIAPPIRPIISRHLRSRLRLVFCVNRMGEKMGMLKDPIGVGELIDGSLVVCEWANRRLQLFSPTGAPIRTLLEGCISPQGIVVTVKGNLLVSDSDHKKVYAFSPSGKSMSKSGIGKFTNPCGLAFSKQGNIIVTDTSDNTVTFYKNDQVVAFTLGARQVGNRYSMQDCYQFKNPLYVASGPNNEILVSDSNNHCVKVFDSQGRFVTRMGGVQGSGDGELSFPRGVCVDSAGDVIVADRNNDRISVFNLRGEFRRHMLTREDGIVSPYAVALTTKNQLAVTESETGRAALKLFQC